MSQGNILSLLELLRADHSTRREGKIDFKVSLPIAIVQGRKSASVEWLKFIAVSSGRKSASGIS